MTPAQLAQKAREVVEAEAKATPGPWKWPDTALVAGYRENILWPSNALSEPETDAEAIGASGTSAEKQAAGNKALIVVARNAAPDLARFALAILEPSEAVVEAGGRGLYESENLAPWVNCSALRRAYWRTKALAAIAAAAREAGKT